MSLLCLTQCTADPACTPILVSISQSYTSLAISKVNGRKLSSINSACLQYIPLFAAGSTKDIPQKQLVFTSVSHRFLSGTKGNTFATTKKSISFPIEPLIP